MATLQKFKLLATQCAVVSGSPTRSPASSPVIHLRRRKTLRMLLSRTGTARRRDDRTDRPSDSSEKTRTAAVGRRLKDLLLSSPPPQTEEKARSVEMARPRGGGNRSAMRPLTATLRQRLMRRSWRPMLVSIPE